MEKKGGKISPPWGRNLQFVYKWPVHNSRNKCRKGWPFDHPENKKITFNVDFRAHKNNVLYIRSTLNVIRLLRFQL